MKIINFSFKFTCNEVGKSFIILFLHFNCCLWRWWIMIFVAAVWNAVAQIWFSGSNGSEICIFNLRWNFFSFLKNTLLLIFLILAGTMKNVSSGIAAVNWHASLTSNAFKIVVTLAFEWSCFTFILDSSVTLFVALIKRSNAAFWLCFHDLILFTLTCLEFF